jgi:predicted tellurium resistance membrane protein TerC
MALTVSRESETGMGIGLGVVLGVIGAVLLFNAVDLPNSWPIAQNTLGWILLIAGILAVVIGLIQTAQRSRTKQITEQRYDGPPR